MVEVCSPNPSRIWHKQRRGTACLQTIASGTLFRTNPIKFKTVIGVYSEILERTGPRKVAAIRMVVAFRPNAVLACFNHEYSRS